MSSVKELDYDSSDSFSHSESDLKLRKTKKSPFSSGRQFQPKFLDEFLTKVKKMLSNTKYRKTVEWKDKCIKVHKKSKFIKSVLPLYFPHRLVTFHRYLNACGFKIQKKTKHSCVFKHEHATDDLNCLLHLKNKHYSVPISNSVSSMKSMETSPVGAVTRNKQNKGSVCRWNFPGKLRLSSSIFKWDVCSKNSGNQTISESNANNKLENTVDYIHFNKELGRAYYSSFIFHNEKFDVGDFVSFGEYERFYRIVGVYQATKSFLGAWNDKHNVTTDIQKRGHPYALLVPLLRDTGISHNPMDAKSSRSSKRKRVGDKARKEKSFQPIPNEIILDCRKICNVDENNIELLPMWFGDKNLNLKKVRVQVLSDLSNSSNMYSPHDQSKHLEQYQVGYSCTDKNKGENSEGRNSSPLKSPLTNQQISLLTSCSTQLISKHISTHWNEKFHAKQIQYTKNSKRKLRGRGQITDNTPLYECEEQSSDDSGDDIDNGSFDAKVNNNSHIKNLTQFESKQKLLKHCGAANFEDARPQFVFEGYINDNESFTNLDNISILNTYFTLPTSEEVNSITDINTLPPLHKDAIHRNELVTDMYGFPELNAVRKFICYNASIQHDLAHIDDHGKDRLLCSIIPALADFGVTVIVDSQPKQIMELLDQFHVADLKSKLLCLYSISDVDCDQEEGMMKRIKNKIRLGKFKGSLIVIATPEILLKRTILEHLSEIEGMRMLKRLVFNEFEVMSTVKICEQFQSVPYSLVSKITNPRLFMDVVESLKESSFRMKPLFFSFNQNLVGFFVEPYLNPTQVSSRISHIVKSFAEESKGDTKRIANGHQKISSPDPFTFPKCLCYCRYDADSQRIKDLLEHNSVMGVDIIRENDSHDTINRIIQDFQSGITHVICLTKEFHGLQNIQDIRFIFHASSALSMKKYTAETRHAGGDGKQSYCILFFNSRQIGRNTNRSHAYDAKIFHYACNGNTNICRHTMLGLKTNQSIDQDQRDEKECLCCDNCRIKFGMEGFLFPAQTSCKEWRCNGMLCKIRSKDEVDFTLVGKHILNKFLLNQYSCAQDDMRRLTLNKHIVKSTRIRMLFKILTLKYSLINDFAQIMKALGVFKSTSIDVYTGKESFRSTEKTNEVLEALQRKSLRLKLRNVPAIVEINDSTTIPKNIGDKKNEDPKSIENMRIKSNERLALNASLNEVLERDREVIEHYNQVVHNQYPLLDMPQYIEPRLFMEVPFAIYFEICRMYHSQNINQMSVNKYVHSEHIKKDSITVVEFLHNISKIYNYQIPRQTVNNQQFNAEFSDTESRTLTLLPPTIKTSQSRIMRKFRSHRFMHICMRSLHKRNIDKLCESPLWICGRKYNFLWASKFSSPQTYVFLAEKGLGISKEEEMDVNDVREWCVPGASTRDLSISKENDIMSSFFSDIVFSGTLPPGCLKIVGDIINETGEITTDRFGLISVPLIDHLWTIYNNTIEKRNGDFDLPYVNESEVQSTISCPYSSFYGHIGGIMGIWIVDPNLGNDMMLICRKSQVKNIAGLKSMPNPICNRNDIVAESEDEYDPAYNTLDVFSWNESFYERTLKSRMIQILEYRGVPSEMLETYVTRSDVLPRILDNLQNKEQFWIAKSQYLRVIPDHTQLLEEGEAFIAGLRQICFNHEYSHILAMCTNAKLPEDLLKFSLPSRLVLRRRALFFSKQEGKVDTSLSSLSEYDRNSLDPYLFFEYLNDPCLVISTKGKSNAISLVSDQMLQGHKVWVCWEKELVNAVNDYTPKENDVVDLEENNIASNVASMTEKDRYNDVWKFRNYGKHLAEYNSMLDSAIDLYGFDHSIPKAIAAHLQSQEKEPNHIWKIPENIKRQYMKDLESKGRPHWNVQHDERNAKSYKSEKAMGILWDRLQYVK